VFTNEQRSTCDNTLQQVIIVPSQTRKLSYRKDDHTTRTTLYIWCSEHVRESWESLSTPMATFPEILTDFCSDRSYEWAYKTWSS